MPGTQQAAQKGQADACPLAAALSSNGMNTNTDSTEMATIASPFAKAALWLALLPYTIWAVVLLFGVTSGNVAGDLLSVVLLASPATSVIAIILAFMTFVHCFIKQNVKGGGRAIVSILLATIYLIPAYMMIELERGRNPAIHVAAAKGNFTKVKALIEKDPTLVEKTDCYGSTALDRAARKGWTEIAEYLIEHGANVNGIKYRDGYAPPTPLYHAAFHGNIEMIKLLIEHGADIHAMGPLHAACDRGHTEVVEYLVQAGADLNITNDRGRTPLIESVLAYSVNSKSIAKCLLENGADPNILDEYGKSAKDYILPRQVKLQKLFEDFGI